MQLKQVDVISAEPPQRGVDRGDHMIARRADVVGLVAEPERRLGGNEHLVAATLDRRAQNVFRFTLGIAVRGVEHGDAGIKADIQQSPRAGRVGVAPRGKEIALAAERARAETESRNGKAGSPQTPIFHDRKTPEYAARCRTSPMQGSQPPHAANSSAGSAAPLP